MQSKITAGTIITRTAALFVAVPLPGVLAYAVLVGPLVLIDLFLSGDEQSWVVLVALASLFAQYLVTLAVLRRLDLAPAVRPPGRTAAFVWTLIVTGLLSGLGFLLLIVPGLYLVARWSIVVPLIIAEGRAVDDSMRASSDRTSGAIVAIMIAFLLVLMPEIVSLAFFARETWGEALPSSPAMVAALDALTYFAMIAGWYASVAIYALTREQPA